MNLSKPIHLIVIGSLLSSFLTVLVLLVFHFILKVEIGVAAFFITFIATFGLTSLIYYYFIKKYINQRIRLIYRIIGNKKFDKNELSESGIRDDVIGDLTKETRRWANEKSEEISHLQQDAHFRKEFIGNLAHELKTPVFSIQGYLLTLLEGGLEDTNVNREFCERALKGVDRISALLKDLDTISQFEINQIELKKKRFDIVELVEEVFQLLASKAELKNITLGFNKSYDQVFVKADRNKIAQVLTNLISNSISYGNDDGHTVIRLHRLESGQILIEVADDGVGMEEKHLNRLFERFYRVDKSRERNIGGSGLGLAIVKHIIEAHGQSINVRSTVDVGSTFSFTLEKG